MEALAEKLGREGRPDEALHMRLEALRVRTELFRGEQPPPFDWLNSVMGTFVGQNQYDEAEPVLNSILTGADDLRRAAPPGSQ